MDTPRVAVLLGPTASGKTDLSLNLARRLDAEIVSADSMLVYRSMDIGTAKPTRAQREEVPHHLIDLVDPHEPYDAARYKRDALCAIHEIASRGKRILVVGGTGLYIRALTMGLFPGPGADPWMRRRLEEWESSMLHQRLWEVDPEGAARINPNDRVRMIRALEVYFLTGKPISVLQRAHGFAQPLFPVLRIGVKVDRSTLTARIRARTEQMFRIGLVEEVHRLVARGYGPRLRPMQTFAYRHGYDVVVGRLSVEEAMQRMIRDTWRLARRQMIWFKKEPAVHWVSLSEEEAMASVLEEFWGSKRTETRLEALSAP